MRKNKLGYFGLLGLLGILGIVTDNKAYLGFFGYFIYFRYFKVIPDELFMENVRKAATPAFFMTVITASITIALTAITNEKAILVFGFLLGLIISLLIFTVLLMYYEFTESRSE